MLLPRVSLMTLLALIAFGLNLGCSSITVPTDTSGSDTISLSGTPASSGSASATSATPSSIPSSQPAQPAQPASPSPESEPTIPLPGDGANFQFTISKLDDTAYVSQLKQVLQGVSGLGVLASFISKNFDHMTPAISTAKALENATPNENGLKVGDCWALSQWSFMILRASGYKVRVVQGPCPGYTRHRQCEVKIDEQVIDFEPTNVVRRWGYRPYTPGCHQSREVITTTDW